MPIKAKTAKAKGAKLEKWLVEEFLKASVPARRQPGSGAFDAFPHDVEATLRDGKKLLCECKQRRSVAWATGERWLGSADVLVVREDAPRDEFGARTPEPRVYMTWATFMRLISQGEQR